MLNFKKWMITSCFTLLLILLSSNLVGAESLQWETKDKVKIDKKWTVTFNQELIDSPANKSLITVYDKTEVKKLDVTVEIQANKVIITPPLNEFHEKTSLTYDDNKSYTLHINEGLTFESGQTYKDNLTMPFNTVRQSYLDEEFKELAHKGILKDVPLKVGDSISDVIAQKGNDYQEVYSAGTTYLYYENDDFYIYGYADADPSKINTVSVRLYGGEYYKKDFLKLFGPRDYLDQIEDAVNPDPNWFKIGNYKLLLENYNSIYVEDDMLVHTITLTKWKKGDFDIN
ncbi:hypothetical protein H0266_18535 [Halobacillus locisalis]|uniref:SbsA Ig-like domain-containing protein n=1 Tax=Halobacillus locisalis TaxID=220753 RepID=A0A838CY72_9BACI|nr:hypothetical protein [Halobacillus locisalis]MBA2176881.1 hypothetical protein [Halobacillus locisalis]